MSVCIGSPLQSTAVKVLLLGAGELGKELCIALQRFGVEVHAADRYADAPAMQLAHHSTVLDMTDAAQLDQLIKKYAPQLIVAEIEAIATDVLIEAEKQGIQVAPSANAVHMTMNRERIRRLAAEELGIATSNFRFASDFNSFKAACDDIGYPCFVKPVMSSSGKGQSRVTEFKQVEPAWQIATEQGRVAQQQVIVESQINFDFEITLLTVRAYNADGEIESYCCDPIGHRQVDGDYVESWQPQPISAAALEKSKHIAKKITSALQGTGIFGVELFIKNDEVWFSEVSPRPHDTGLVTLASQFQNQFELHARAILGLPVDPERHSEAASAVIYAGVDATNLSFDHLSEALLAPGTDLRLFGKPEGFIKRRMGVVTARAASTEQARANASEAVSKIEIRVND